MTSEDAIPVTVIAKEYGMSGVTFNKLLNSEQIQYVRDGVWLLYRKYDNRGYTVTQTFVLNERAAGRKNFCKEVKSLLSRVLKHRRPTAFYKENPDEPTD